MIVSLLLCLLVVVVMGNIVGVVSRASSAVQQIRRFSLSQPPTPSFGPVVRTKTIWTLATVAAITTRFASRGSVRFVRRETRQRFLVWDLTALVAHATRSSVCTRTARKIASTVSLERARYVYVSGFAIVSFRMLIGRSVSEPNTGLCRRGARLRRQLQRHQFGDQRRAFGLCAHCHDHRRSPLIEQNAKQNPSF